MVEDTVTHRVSVAMPVRNAGAFVAEALDSISKQTFQDVELVVVDDASEDDSRAVVDAWSKSAAAERFRHGRLFIVNLPRNVGYAGAYTMAMTLARAPFIALQEADDISHPSRIERQMAHLSARPGVAIVGTMVRTFQADRPDVRDIMDHVEADSSSARAAYLRNYTYTATFGTLLFRREVFDEVGGLLSWLPPWPLFYRQTAIGQDAEWIRRALRAGFDLENIMSPLYSYRLHEGQLTKTARSGKCP